MIYQKVCEAMKAMTEGVELAQSKMNCIGGKPSEYIQELIDGLFSFAQFKEGDRVQLSKTPRITQEKSWGWMGSKQFLKKDAMATVESVGWRAKGKTFTYGIVFDDETFINSITKKPESVDHKHSYCFSESYIKRSC